MHKKVMLEFPDGPRRWGYATTENTANPNKPVITLDGVFYSAADIKEGGIQIISNDIETLSALRNAQYNPKDSNRDSVKVRKGVSLPSELVELIEADAEREGINFSNKVVRILENYYANGIAYPDALTC